MAFDMKDRLGQLKHVVSRITATEYKYNRKPYAVRVPPYTKPYRSLGAASSRLYLDFDRQAPIQIIDDVFTM